MSSSTVIGYEMATAAPVELTDSDIEGWVLAESGEETLPRLMTRRFSSEGTLLLDFGGRMPGGEAGFNSIEAGEASRYAFSCEGDAGGYAEMLASGLAAALNLNEEEHVALLSAARTYYSNAEAGGVISISSMLPEKSRQLELLKMKLDELAVIPPAFGPSGVKPGRIEVDLGRVDGRYARRALAYVVLAKYVIDHPGASIIVASFEEMLPEAQTRSMRYPMEVASSFFWSMKKAGTKIVAQSRRPLPREMEGIFETRLLEADGFIRMKGPGSRWKEVYLVNDCLGSPPSEGGYPEGAKFEDEEAERTVLSTVSSYSNVTYAGLVSFLKGRMEEQRIQQAMDFLIGGGYVELRKGQGEAHYLTLTDSGKNLLSLMEGSPA
jgi:hypothetical protein